MLLLMWFDNSFQECARHGPTLLHCLLVDHRMKMVCEINKNLILCRVRITYRSRIKLIGWQTQSTSRAYRSHGCPKKRKNIIMTWYTLNSTAKCYNVRSPVHLDHNCSEHTDGKVICESGERGEISLGIPQSKYMIDTARDIAYATDKYHSI